MKDLEQYIEPNEMTIPQFDARDNDALSIILAKVYREMGLQKAREKQGKEYEPNLKFEFEYKDVVDFLGMDTSRAKNCFDKNISKHFGNLLENQKPICINKKDGGEKKFFVLTGYETFPKRVELSVNPDILPVLKACEKTGYAQIDTLVSLSLKSKYSKRILKELCAKKGISGWVYAFKIDDFRSIIGECGSYKVFSKFKERCLVKPLKEIMEASGGKWYATDGGDGFELVKEGRSYTHIVLNMAFDPTGAPDEVMPDEVDEKYL